MLSPKLFPQKRRSLYFNESFQQEDIKIIYAYSIRAHKGIKQILELKEKKLIAYKGCKGLQ